MHALFFGFSLGFSLILAIGAQNAFVLKQGLKGEHVLLVCPLFAKARAWRILDFLIGCVMWEIVLRLVFLS
jgi:L-lysine exporter family protein LysE/ArgO